MAHQLNEIASGVACLPVSIANVYLVGDRGSDWILVDAGVAGSARTIREAAEARFGPNAKPSCIVLTHGHMDHAGSALDLATRWDVPIFAHALELPYLTGKSVYPPTDPTAPGFLSFVTRFFPPQGFDFGDRVRPFEEGKFPLRNWTWHHTPGHSPGHTAFFRSTDATLLAGDAFATVNLDSLLDILSKKQQVSRPTTPATCDWKAAAESVKKLDALNPLTFGCGHGVPMSGPEAAAELEYFAYHFPFPSHGRYAHQPAETDEGGVVRLPPPPPDKAPGVAGALGIATLSGVMFAVAAQRRKKLLQSH
jgi:glyoxylase-like metal-dependent hydrolase (beta-lactamase superfamily II)